MNFNKLAKESHANAVKHGFWEKRESNEHCLMLVVSEIGEMVEAHRAGKRANLEAYNEPLLGGCAPFTSFIKDTLEDGNGGRCNSPWRPCRSVGRGL